jgi:hypothetical protein
MRHTAERGDGKGQAPQRVEGLGGLISREHVSGSSKAMAK